MRDIKKTATFSGQLFQCHKQRIGLLRGQNRGRFVQHQQFGIAQQSADDLDALPLARRQAVDRTLRRQRQPVSLADLLDTFGQFAEVEPVLPDRAGQRDCNIFENTHIFKQREMLEHHADAQFGGVLRTFELHCLAIPDDFAFIGAQQTVEDFHQGGFARAVLSQQRVDLPALDTETDPVIGGKGPEAFGDPGHLHQQA